MQPESAYTILTLVTLAICAFGAAVRPAGREPLAALLFIVMFTFAMKLIIVSVNAAGYELRPPASMILYPVQDLLCLAVCAWTYMRRYGLWKLALGFGFLGQILSHAAFWASLDTRYGSDTAKLVLYMSVNNSWAFYQLLVLALTGGTHAASWIGDCIASRRSSHQPHLARTGI